MAESQVSLGRPERPILSSGDDKLERGGFVRRLADALINPQTRLATGVVVGITGAWGSGKSSILNLLREYIATSYDQALVVRFDPWLVSGRNDLITEFIGEVIRTIKSNPHLSKQFKGAVETLAKYGDHLAPIGGLWNPAAVPVIKTASRVLAQALKTDVSLATLRQRLMKELTKTSVPIVVLIDEVDRIEDDEIRTVAQLVRSVADFPGISYVLAYDPKRVVQALGTGRSDSGREERGRAYLEKIVQLQIPIPITFGEEVGRLLTAELSALQQDLQLPGDFQDNQRYQRLVGLLTTGLIETPRDISRLVGTFHVLAGMLREEVDLIDLLAYCALLAKVTPVADAIRLKPDEFIDDMLSEAAVRRHFDQKRTPRERLKAVVPDAANDEGIGKVLAFLFPAFSEDRSPLEESRLALHHRRPLLTTLRLGLLPGTYSRAEIEALVLMEPTGVAARLAAAYAEDALELLIDRLDELYENLVRLDHVQFWLGVGRFLRKPGCEWMTRYSPMHEVARNFANILDRAVTRNKNFRTTAAEIFVALRNSEEDELTPHWIRRHIFAHSLFGNKNQGRGGIFLTASETEATAKDMCDKWRASHFADQLIPCRWDLMPVYTMLDTGHWDDECRMLIDRALQNDRPVDGLSLMMFGGGYTTDKATVGRICSYDKYIRRVRERFAATDLHESVKVALQKAVESTY